MFPDRTKIARFFVCIFTENKSDFWVFRGGRQCKKSSNKNSLASSSQYCKCHTSQFVWHLWRIFLSKECVYNSSWIHKSVKSYVLEDESICASVIHKLCFQILSSRRISFFISMDFILGCFFQGLLLLPLLLSRRLGFSRFVEATVSRCVLESLTFVSTLFESFEPYSWYSTVGLEDSKYLLSKFSSFLRNLLNRNSPSTHYLSKFSWK